MVFAFRWDYRGANAGPWQWFRDVAFEGRPADEIALMRWAAASLPHALTFPK
jgi:hypothetical protein